MKIEEGETIQKGVPTPDNPVEIINIFKDLDYAVKIVEGIRNRTTKVTLVNIPEDEKEYKIPFLNATESQAVTTVLYRLSEYSEEINKLNNAIDRIIECVLLHKPFATFVCQNVSVNECNKYRENGGCNQCIKEYFMNQLTVK